MAADNDYFGQESDVNRACSAFGLDTVNYRAFPDNGPVPQPPAEPVAAPDVAEARVTSMPVTPVADLPISSSQPLQAPPPAAPQLPPHAYAPAIQNTTFNSDQQPAPLVYVARPPVHAMQEAAGFTLLAQALPAATPGVSAQPLTAFAMSRFPLQPMIPTGAAQAGILPPPTAPVQAAPVQAATETFGLAFAAAFKAAFGTAPAAPAPTANPLNF